MNLRLTFSALLFAGCISSPQGSVSDMGSDPKNSEDVSTDIPRDSNSDIASDMTSDTQASRCGNGILDADEICDPGVPVASTCNDVGKNGAQPLVCTSNCELSETVCDCGFFVDSENDTFGTAGTFEDPASDIQAGVAYIDSGLGKRLVCVKSGSRFKVDQPISLNGDGDQNGSRGFVVYGDGPAPILDGGTPLTFTGQTGVFTAPYDGPPIEFLYDNGAYIPFVESNPQLGQFTIVAGNIEYVADERPSESVALTNVVFLVSATQPSSNTLIQGFDVRNATVAVEIEQASENFRFLDNDLSTVRVGLRSQRGNQQILNTVFAGNTQQDGVRLVHFTTPSFGTVKGLRIESNVYAGIDSESESETRIETTDITDVTIRGNSIRSGGVGTSIFARFNDMNVGNLNRNYIIEQNFIEGSVRGIALMRATGAKVRNNILMNATTGIDVLDQSDGVLVEHNTVVNSNVCFRSSSSDAFTFQRNIGVTDNNFVQATAVNGGTFNHNLYSGDDPLPIRLDNQQISFTAWQGEQDANSTQIPSPGFVTTPPTEPEDVRLMPNTGARDPDPNVSETTVDFGGRTRDDNPDYGAWEGN